jgi:hypothetical protein
MITHEDILAKLSQTPPSPPDGIWDSPPIFFNQRDPDSDSDEDDKLAVTHKEFINFVRACIGVASILGVLAWADSVGNDDCRERTLAVVQLWQGIEGYREVSHYTCLHCFF